MNSQKTELEDKKHTDVIQRKRHAEFIQNQHAKVQ